MRRTLVYSLFLIFTTMFFARAMSAAALQIGIISLDQIAGTTGTFNIVNQTGPNASAFPDVAFPVTTPLALGNFTLKLDFQGGGTVTENASRFASDGSGGFTGNFLLDLSKVSLLDATLTGTADQSSVQLNDGTTAAISPAFSSTIVPSSGNFLMLADFQLIDVSSTPEPGTCVLVSLGCAAMLYARKARRPLSEMKQ